MPSTKDPQSTVQPGPGKLPTGVATAGSLLFPPGGGAGAALQAHIHNPHDAHMANAIGIPPVSPYGVPLLSIAGGVIDGESVLDFIIQFKDLIPPHPNWLGYNSSVGVNSGIPTWTNFTSAVTGGYTLGGAIVPTHFLLPNTVSNFNLAGMIYPADRGVLTLYKNTSGNFFDAANTTLVAALWLGPDPAPAGIPSAAFDETLRTGQQPDHTTGAGLDLFALFYRLPYLTSYAAYPGAPYTPYLTNFYSFQLATFNILAQTIAVGDSQNWLLVHWRETHANSLTAIQPAGLTLASLVAANCYSAVPSGGNFDDNTAAIYNVNRHHVFRDANSAVAPALSLFAASLSGSSTAGFLSGVLTIAVTSGWSWDTDLAGSHLFANSYQTGSNDFPPYVPAQFHSAYDPMTIDLSQFGDRVLHRVPYWMLQKQGIPGTYSLSNPPLTADVGEYVNSALSLLSPVSYTPTGLTGSKIIVTLRNAFNSTVVSDPMWTYSFNSYPQDGTALNTIGTPRTSFEPFVDEYYRYTAAFSPIPSSPLAPAVSYPAYASLATNVDELQVVGNLLVYPQIDYSTGWLPPGPNYSTLPGSDAVNHLRRYVRALDTRIPRNTGKLRINGIAQAAFQTNAAYDGTETTGHITGGAIIQIMVPGVTGWLDLGRLLGDPGIATSNFYGCQTAVTVSGADTIVSFNTTAFTGNNGSGVFPLFVRISFLNNAAGRALRLDEIQWLAP